MFKERISQRGALQNLEDIAEASYTYAMLLNKEIETLDDDLNATLDRINLFSETHRVFLLPVIGGDFSDEAKNYAARATEMLAFRWTLRGGNAQVLETIYQKYAARIREEALPDKAGALTGILEDLMNEAPSDEEIRNEILASSAKGNLTNYVLTRVEGALSGDLLRWTKQPVWLEQFAPKAPSKDSDWYDVIAPATGAGDEKSYDDFAQMWGNQTLVEFQLHASLKHSHWANKVNGSLEHKGLIASEAQMNRQAVSFPAWTKDLIVARTQWLADAVVLVSSVNAAQNESVRVEAFVAGYA